MTVQLSLPVCVLPGCETPVTGWGDACGGCRAAFGPHLHQTLHGELLTAEQIEQRDSHVHRAYALHRSARP